MGKLKQGILRLNRFFAEICGWLLSVIMLLLIVDFFSRGISMPIQGVGEIAVFVMVATVYLGLAHTEQTRGNVRVTAVISRFSPRAQSLINVLVYLLATATMTVVLWAVSLNAVKAFYSHEAVAGTVPLLVWPVKFVIVLGCFLYLVQIVLNTVEEFQKLVSSKS